MAGQGRLGSPVILAAILVAVVAALFFSAAAFGPARWLAVVVYAWRRCTSRLTSVGPPREAMLGVALGVLAVGTYAALVPIFYELQRSPEGNDQGAYLDTAREVQADGGATALVGQLFRGEFAEANRHPLYIALLSWRPAFDDGKRLSIALGGLALIALSCAIARCYSPLAGGLFAVMLATNFAFCYVSTLVACEVLLVLISAATWLVASGGAPSDDARKTQRAISHAKGEVKRQGTQRLAWMRPAFVGALLGAAYLTKATGLLLFVGYVATLFVGRTRWGRSIAFALVSLIGFSAVASPLLVRNVRRFDNPTYNVNSYLLFVDQYVHPDHLAARLTVGEAARHYVETHTARDVARREATGLVWEAFIMARSLGPTPLDDSRLLFGLIWLALAAIGMATEPGRGARLMIAWSLLLWPTFAWYIPIAAGERFILPLLVPLLAHAAAGGARLIALAMERRRANSVRVAVLVAAILWCAACYLATTSLAAPSLPARFH